jgi:hypothetical protein
LFLRLWLVRQNAYIDKQTSVTIHGESGE